MALSEVDRNLLQKCLSRKPRSWEDFVDRFMGLAVHVVNHASQSRSIRLSPEDREDLVAAVFLAILKDDMAVLRQFRGESSLATYLTVVARRVVIHEVLRTRSPARLGSARLDSDAKHDGDAHGAAAAEQIAQHSDIEQRVSDRELVERLLDELDGIEAQVVRLYHLEGKSYGEISSATGIAENSIGPTLSRARSKMRRAGADHAHESPH